MRNESFEEKVRETFKKPKITNLLLTVIIGVSIISIISAVGNDKSILENFINEFVNQSFFGVITISIIPVFSYMISLYSQRHVKYIIRNYVDDDEAVRTYIQKLRDGIPDSQRKGTGENALKYTNYNELLTYLKGDVIDTSIFDVIDVYDYMENNKDYLKGFNS